MSDHAQLLAALNEPVLQFTLEGLVSFSTRAAAELTGRESDYAFAELLSGNDKARFQQAMQRIAEGKTNSTRVEVSFPTEGGTPTPIDIKLCVIAGANGKPTAVAAWLRDLSLEKANEAAANVQGTHLLDLVENISDACVIESADGGIEVINQSFCDLFSVSSAPQSLVGTACAELFERASQVTEKRVGPVYFPLEANRGQLVDELTFSLASGLGVAQTSITVSGSGGAAGRMHLFHRVQAAATDFAKPSLGGATLASQMPVVEKIARDLVVTVESAGNAVHRAEQMDLPSRVLDQLKRIESSAMGVFTSIAGLLDFSRIEGGELELESSEFKLRESLASLVERMVPLAERSNVQFVVRVEQDVPDILIGDGARLMLCLRNLLECGFAEYALQHVTGGETKVVIEPEYSADDQIHLSFTVEHRLPKGMSHSKAMAPAAQMQLALSRQIVRAITDGKGKIDVRERKEALSYQFTAAFAFSPVRDTRIRPTFVTLTSLPVLIVSSDAEERQRLSESLRSWRMHPREADNVAVALQLLTRMAEEEHHIPLVITANHLPVQDGFLLGFRVRYTPKLRNTAVIMLSKVGKPGDAITCRENGISAYLRQPIADQSLNEAITAVMGTQDDSEATTTLITRHSLRERKEGTVLVIDKERDTAAQAIAAMRKRDYRVVIVDSLALAAEAMLAEPFDAIVVDPADLNGPTLGELPDHLRKQHTHKSPPPKVMLASESPRTTPNDGFDGFILKPYRKESLLIGVGELLKATRQAE